MLTFAPYKAFGTDVVKNWFVAEKGETTYYVSKSSFGWHAKMKTPTSNMVVVAGLLYTTRKQAEAACQNHAK